jgi:hypothetical protein
VRVEGFKSQEELVENLYQASTLADKNARPYAGSDISIEEIAVDSFHPTQRYVIDSGVHMQSDLRELILPYGEDTLHMGTGGIDIVDEENGGEESCSHLLSRKIIMKDCYLLMVCIEQHWRGVWV